MSKLDEIREREKKATKGPLIHFKAGRVYDVLPACRPGHIFQSASRSDAIFYMNSRTDIPFLLNLVDEAREIISGVRDALSNVGLPVHAHETCDEWLEKVKR